MLSCLIFLVGPYILNVVLNDCLGHWEHTVQHLRDARLRTSDALLLSMVLFAGILCTLSNNYAILAYRTILYIISTKIILSYNKINIRVY